MAGKRRKAGAEIDGCAHICVKNHNVSVFKQRELPEMDKAAAQPAWIICRAQFFWNSNKEITG
jgi:hypothetical protein